MVCIIVLRVHKMHNISYKFNHINSIIKLEHFKSNSIIFSTNRSYLEITATVVSNDTDWIYILLTNF